jgi:protein-S-isoprenylcysteine O-methyltransferase Ste14
MGWVSKRIVIQTIAFLALYALIFICAGTIDFWQGWLFCITFTLSTLGIGIYLLLYDRPLLQRRLRAGPANESHPIQKFLMTIMMLSFIVLMIVGGLDHRFGWSQVPDAIVVLANVMIVVALGLCLIVMRENSYAASTITVESGQRVISSGFYAYVRHPSTPPTCCL